MAGLVMQILAALQYIHNSNIVHLDIKPENIVCKDRYTQHKFENKSWIVQSLYFIKQVQSSTEYRSYAALASF